MGALRDRVVKAVDFNSLVRSTLVVSNCFIREHCPAGLGKIDGSTRLADRVQHTYRRGARLGSPSTNNTRRVAICWCGSKPKTIKSTWPRMFGCQLCRFNRLSCDKYMIVSPMRLSNIKKFLEAILIVRLEHLSSRNYCSSGFGAEQVGKSKERSRGNRMKTIVRESEAR